MSQCQGHAKQQERDETDLLARLRADAEYTDDIGLCADAAKEIEQLRQRVADLEQD